MMEDLFIFSYIFLWIIVLVAVVLLLAVIRRVNQIPEINIGLNPLRTGTKAPEFKAISLNGEIVSLDDFIGRRVALIFISSGCKPCEDEIRSLEKSKDQIFETVGVPVFISIDGPKDTEDLISDLDISLPVYVAPHKTNSFMQDYRAIAAPYYCVLSEDGTVVSTGLMGPGSKWEALVNDGKSLMSNEGHIAEDTRTSKEV